MINNKVVDLILFLEKRIEVTKIERESLDTTDILNFNTNIAKGGKLTAYKEILEHIKAHNINLIDDTELLKEIDNLKNVLRYASLKMK